ncbi:exported hypothetical protein [uncultured Paludibacter sp.]|nr:exported hypothetical protein [uncultured Paludibacter sp.]
MKINKCFYIFAITVVVAVFTACSQFEDTVTPSPTVSTDNPAVRFVPNNTKSFEFDPSGVMSFTLQVIRNHSSSTLEVPITVVKNPNNSFIIPEKVSFEANKDTANIIINVNPSAETGVALPIELSFEDQYTNPYKVEYSDYIGVVSLIKWNNLGNGQFFDSFSFTTSSAGYIASVKIEQRDDKPSIYRISYPYSVAILTAAEWDNWIGGNTQQFIYFTVSSDGKNVTWDKFWYTNLIYQGTAGQYIKAYLPSAINKTGDAKSIVVYNSDNSIKYFELYPSFYIDGLGGWGLNEVDLAFPGYDLSAETGFSIIY